MQYKLYNRGVYYLTEWTGPDQTKSAHYYAKQIGHEVLNACVKYTCMYIMCRLHLTCVTSQWRCRNACACSTLLSREEVEKIGLA